MENKGIKYEFTAKVWNYFNTAASPENMETLKSQLEQALKQQWGWIVFQQYFHMAYGFAMRAQFSRK